MSRRARAVALLRARPVRRGGRGGDRRRLRLQRRARLRPAAAGRRARGRPARRPADRAAARSPRALEVRRVPERFVPAGALAVPGDALGLVPLGPAPAGSYLLASQLRPPRRPRRPGLAGGRRPVEISVSGADALLALAAGERLEGRRRRHHRTRGAGTGPHLRRGRRRAAAGARARRRRSGPGRRLGGDAGADPGSGPAADRGRKLRPEADPAPAAASHGGRPPAARSRSSPRPCARG